MPLLPVGLGILLTGVVVAIVLAASSTSSSSHPLVESIFQDDDHLLYAPTATVSSTLDMLKALGVDRLRLTIVWKAIAPDPMSRTPPQGFDAADPATYPPAAWGPYDRIAELARARGIGVDFDVSAPGPLWAMATGAPNGKSADHYYPSAKDFGQFVTALGTRYSGRYREPVRLGGSRYPLPRVSYWSIWNEPNQPGWLSPQWGSLGGRPVMEAAALYRQYADQAFAALQRTGHSPSTDTVLIGELAPEGSETSGVGAPIPPMPFLRAMYCVDSAYRPLSGAAALALGCPRSGSAAGFVAAHPGLFQETGFAHHPYSFFLPPAAQMPDPNFVPLSDLTRLEHGLDAIFHSYGVNRQLPIYLTEYGYETNPPNPYRGVSPHRQALYLDQAQYMASRDPRVRSFSQFLLYDSPPDRSYPPGSLGYWSTFQTGLRYADGGVKPSLDAYRLPIWVPSPSFAPGSPTTIWGMLRAAPNDTTQHAQIQWRSPNGQYRTIATITTHDPSGFLTAHVVLPGSGAVRIEWASPSGQSYLSRPASVTRG